MDSEVAFELGKKAVSFVKATPHSLPGLWCTAELEESLRSQSQPSINLFLQSVKGKLQQNEVQNDFSS